MKQTDSHALRFKYGIIGWGRGSGCEPFFPIPKAEKDSQRRIVLETIFLTITRVCPSFEPDCVNSKVRQACSTIFRLVVMPYLLTQQVTEAAVLPIFSVKWLKW